ncbi:hypothetical protein KMC43_gp62 [Ralstonia phage Raharianne]|uniref:Uncharacterized protein n=2 Tax=Rahariannevirus raharianne TaxID=2846050 RepID=A0A7G5BBF8_9CAUD|nr:hypothetical protein KMC43_gp62 [Ralstonia phage Raharianne]QMV32437.1 hypothetical protein U2_00062 [Ralstonia phage Albius]QMV33631.1 hypothetical protein Y2_00062 [Ralstonia phage Raharianne]
MADLDLNELERLAREATPQDFDSGEIMRNAGEWIDCPHCGGEGAVQLEIDYCNYDGQALGVQFYGIGNAHGAAERYYRAMRPAVALTMIACIRELEAAEAEVERLRNLCGEMYQVAGAHDASTTVLDQLVAATEGVPLPHETLLPYVPPVEAAGMELSDEVADPVCKNGADCSAAQRCVHGCEGPQQQAEPKQLTDEEQKAFEDWHAEWMPSYQLGSYRKAP